MRPALSGGRRAKVSSEGLSSLAIDTIRLPFHWAKRGGRNFHSLPHFWHTEANTVALATQSWGLPSATLS